MQRPTPESVQIWLREARAGNAAQRDRLLETCRHYLQYVARAQLESALAGKVDASDVVQETLLDAYRDFARFQGQTEGEWLAWLRQILQHNLMDHLRRARAAKRGAGRELPLERARSGDASGMALDPPGREETPSQVLVHMDRQLEVAAALEQLSADHREVIVLRNLRRLSFDEVAEALGRSRPAAQMLWARAIKRLTEILGPREEGSLSPQRRPATLE